jgi:hypothetical protein
MIKKLTLAFLISIAVTVLVISFGLLLHSIAGPKEDAYQAFLGDVFAQNMKPESPAYNSWVVGLKEEHKFTVHKITPTIKIFQVEEKEGLAVVAFMLTITIHCRTMDMDKVSVIVDRIAVAIMEQNPKTLENLIKVRIGGSSTTKIVDGWDGEQDI